MGYAFEHAKVLQLQMLKVTLQPYNKSCIYCLSIVMAGVDSRILLVSSKTCPMPQWGIYDVDRWISLLKEKRIRLFVFWLNFFSTRKSHFI